MSTGSVFMSDVFLSSFSAAWQCLHTLITSGVFQGPSRSARHSTASSALAPNPPLTPPHTHTPLGTPVPHKNTRFQFFFPPPSSVHCNCLVFNSTHPIKPRLELQPDFGRGGGGHPGTGGRRRFRLGGCGVAEAQIWGGLEAELGGSGSSFEKWPAWLR